MTSEAEKKILITAANIWMRCYRKDESGCCLTINNKDDLIAFLNAADVLKIKRDNFIATKHLRFYELNTSEYYDEKLSIDDAVSLGITTVKKEKIRAIDKGRGISRYDFLRISTRRVDAKRHHDKSIYTISFVLNMVLIASECGF